MNNGFILTDITGIELTAEDKEILEHPSIFGLLLFTRNYENPQQLKALTQSIYKFRPDLLITVDQEGGRVQRFREGFSTLKSMSYWGALYETNPEQAKEGLSEQTTLLIRELQQPGVQISLMPVLDIDYKISEVIGERSFHQNPEVVVEMASCVLDTMRQMKMPNIGKHFPGHGAVQQDSHHELPFDNRSWEEIWSQDLLPYRSLINKLDAIMPAHIVYKQIDEKPAGFSKKWLTEILRGELAFEGMILSDDLSMLATKNYGDSLERAYLAIDAGCNNVIIVNNKKDTSYLIDNQEKIDHPWKGSKNNHYIRNLT